MNEQAAAFVIAIIELVLKYGVPGAIAVVQSLQVQDPSLEEIQALKNRVPPPGSYLGGSA